MGNEDNAAAWEERLFLTMTTFAPPHFEEPKWRYFILDDFFPFFVASRNWLIDPFAVCRTPQSFRYDSYTFYIKVFFNGKKIK